MGALAVTGGLASHQVADAPRGTQGRFPSLTSSRRLRVALATPHDVMLRPILDRFEAAHGTAVQIVASSPSELYATLAVDLLHQTASFDVVSLSDDWIPSLGRVSALEEGDGLLEDDVGGLLDGSLLALGRSPADERLVAVPWTQDVGFTAIRSSALDGGATPRRWGELLGALDRRGVTTVGMVGASGDPAATSFRAVLAGYGLDIVEPETNRPTVNDYLAREAMEVMTRLQGHMAVSPLAVDDQALVGMVSGGTVSVCAHGWATTWLAGGANGDWTFLPALRATTPRGRRLMRAWLLAIPKTAKDPGLARALVAWMLSTDAQRMVLEAGLLPTTRPVLGDPAEHAARPIFAQIVGGIGSAAPRPRLRAYPEIHRVCGEAVANVLAGNATPGAALRAANSEMRRVLVREGELNL